MSDRLKPPMSRRDFFKFATGLTLEAALGSGERIEVQPMPENMFLDPNRGLGVAKKGQLIG